MGCSQAKTPDKASVGGAAAEKTSAAAKVREKLDPKDYVISKKKDEAIVKEDGTIRGQQFNIEDCENCDIYLFDYIAQAFVDDCKHCRLFVGPVESSLFIRNCTDCDIVCACRQLRTRDCTNCKLSLFVGTEPIIETSQNMQFACFDFFYFSFRDQLEKAGLKVWNNKWWQVYDFNKNADASNWSLLPQEAVPSLLRAAEHTSITREELEMDRVVPLTLGSRPRPSEEACLVVFLPESEALVEAFLAKAKAEAWALCRTRATALTEERLRALFAFAGAKELPKLAAACRGREVTGVEACGAGICQQVREAMQTTGLAAGAQSIRIVPEAETHALAKAFFEVWKDEI